MKGQLRSPQCAAQGQQTRGGVIILTRTTSQSTCRAVGPIDRSRLPRAATTASPDATSVVSTNHPSIGAPPMGNCSLVASRRHEALAADGSSARHYQ